MRKKQVKQVKILGVFLILLILSPCLCVASPATLKALCVFEPSRDGVVAMTWLKEKVEAIPGSGIKINIIGGPDLIPIPEQARALTDGTIDLLIIFTTTFEDRTPQTIPMATSQVKPWEEREIGFYTWLNTKLASNNMRLICRAQSEYGYYFFGNKKLEKLTDFKGQKVGVTPLWVPFMKGLGAVPILIDEPNLYTALSRGTLDAICLPPDSQRALGLNEVSKYIIGPKFYQAANFVIVINTKSWNKLSSEQQAIIDDAGAEVEREIVEYFGIGQARDIEMLCSEGGMEHIELSDEDSQIYINIANEVIWEKAKEKNTPEDYEALRGFLQ